MTIQILAASSAIMHLLCTGQETRVLKSSVDEYSYSTEYHIDPELMEWCTDDCRIIAPLERMNDELIVFANTESFKFNLTEMYNRQTGEHLMISQRNHHSAYPVSTRRKGTCEVFPD